MRVNRLDLNLLAVLDTLLSERSVTKAADVLCLSQGATSNALRRLRETFEDPLLVSNGRGDMVPTIFALEIAEEVKNIVNRAYWLSAARAEFDPKTTRRHFIIMLSDYAASMLMGKVVQRLAAEAPGATIEMVPLSTDLPTSLERGESDLIIVPPVEGMAAYPSDSLFSDEPVCVAWRGNSSLGAELTVQDYFNAEHAMYLPPFPADAKSVLHIEGNTKVAINVPFYMLLPSVITGTNRIATMSRKSAELAAEAFSLRIFPVPISMRPIEEWMFWHPTRGEDAARVWLRSVFKGVAEGIGGANALQSDNTFASEAQA